MKKLTIALFLLALNGCATSGQTGAAVGGLSGAALGGIIGHQSGHGVGGAAIGGALGTVGGMVVGNKRDNKFCPVCGRQYPGDTQFCSKDGSELKIRE